MPKQKFGRGVGKYMKSPDFPTPTNFRIGIDGPLLGALTVKLIVTGLATLGIISLTAH
jgi:hypothetical protein